jgi:hemolysin activation/secretion protein
MFFNSLQRRLQLTIVGFSDFEPDRLLAGQEVDERRTGGSIEASVDLLRDLQGHWLRFDLVGSFRRSSLEQKKDTFQHENLSTLDVGLLHFKRWEGTPGSARLDFQPTVRLGYGNQEGVWFFKPSFQGTYHRFISAFLQWECNAAFTWASADTPSVELPSLGGESSVRGYRKDAGVGRISWAVQNELWIPVRIRLGLPEEWDKIVRRNLAVAAFADLGGVHQSIDGFSGVKAGVGLGLRFVYGDLTLRLDWAHALDEPNHQRGGSMFYFTVTAFQGL